MPPTTHGSLKIQRQLQQIIKRQTEDWKKCVGHAMKVEDEWSQKESAGAGSVDPTVINFDDKASSTDESIDELKMTGSSLHGEAMTMRRH